MPIVNQARAVKDLGQHLPYLDVIVREAWGDLDALPLNLQLKMSARTRASLIHDFMLDRAAQYAAETGGVRYFERQSMCGLVVDGRYAIRFKKLDEDGLSRNQPTLQVAEFRNQVELDGIDAAHHLEVGYVMNAFGTEVSDVRVTCPAGRGNAWSMSIRGESVATVIADIFADQSIDEVQEAAVVPRQTSADILEFSRTPKQ